MEVTSTANNNSRFVDGFHHIDEIIFNALKVPAVLLLITCPVVDAFAPHTMSGPKCTQLAMKDNTNNQERNISMKSVVASAILGLVVSSASMFGGPAAFAADSTQYDGFAEYAKENKMEQSDVG